MTCVTCGTVGPVGATWCPTCFMPYVRAGSSIPPQGFAPAPAPVQPVYAAAGAYAPPANPFAAPPPPMYAPQSWPAELGLVLPEHAVATGDLPRICVVTGQPTDNMVKMRWTWAPAWTYLLGLLIRHILSDRVAGYLPVHPSVHGRHQRGVRGSIVGFVVGLIVMIVGAMVALPVAMVGLAMIVASMIVLFQHRQLVQVERAAPGFLALPKASREFSAAFHAGRPAGQLPYSSVPAKFSTRKIYYVLAALLVPLMGLGVFAAVQHDHACRLSTLHPNVALVGAAVDQDAMTVEQISTAANGQGWTVAQAQQVLKADSTMKDTLATVRLSAHDRDAVDAYVDVVDRYDAALATRLDADSAAAKATYDSAAKLLQASTQNLDQQLRAIPLDCQDN